MRDWQLQQLDKVIEFGEKITYYNETEQDFNIIDVDDNFCAMLGFTREELMVQCRGKMWELVYPPDLRETHGEVIEALRKKGEYAVRFRMKRKTGEFLWVWETGIIEKKVEENHQVRSLTLNIDALEMMRREQSIVLDNLPVGILRLLITDTNFYIIQANQECLDMLGTTKDEYVGSSGIFTFVEDLPRVRAHLIHAAKSKSSLEHTFRCYRGGTGELCWLRLSGRFYDEQEDGKEYLCIFVNVTERQGHIAQLEHERERYRLAMRFLADYICEYNIKTKELKVFGDSDNGRFVPCLEEGFYPVGEDILRKNDFVCQEDYEICHNIIHMKERRPVRIRIMAREKETGRTGYEWYEVESKFIHYHGELYAFVGSLRHLTELEREKKKQLDLQKIYAEQGNKIFEMIICLDVSSGKIQGYFMNDTVFEDVFPEDDFTTYVEHTASEYIHPEDRSRFRQSMQLIHMKEVLDHSGSGETLSFRVKMGAEEKYRYKCLKYSYLASEQNIIIINAQDMNQFYETQLREEDANRKILESALSEKQSINDIRRNFSLMITRELRAPLQVIEKKFGAGADLSQPDEMWDAIQYSKKVLDNIAEFEKLERGQVHFDNRKFELSRLLSDVIERYRTSAGKLQMEIICQLNLQHDYYYGDKRRIAQFFSNVIGNCMLASEGKGKIRIWAHDEDQGDGITRFYLTVEDTGIPVKQSFFGRNYAVDSIKGKSMWELYDRTNSAEFSLLLAKKIIEVMGGKVHLSRKKDQINVIDIVLPLKNVIDSRDSVIVDYQQKSGEVDLSCYTLLLIENEERQDFLHGPLLKLSGAKVDMAVSGKEAIQLWNAYPERGFHAIILNGSLKDVDYIEFAEWFRSQDAEGAKTLPIIVLADNVGPDTVRESMRAGVNIILPRPLDLERLKKVLDMFMVYGPDL